MASRTCGCAPDSKASHIRGWAGRELRNDIKTLLISKITGILEEQLSSIVRPWTASSKNFICFSSSW